MAEAREMKGPMDVDYQKMLAYFMLTDPEKLPFNDLPTPEWMLELGQDLHKLFKEKKISKIYYDSNGKIHIV